MLRQRLVAIYEAGSPDVLSVVLDSASWSQRQRPRRIPEPGPGLRQLRRRPGQGPARRGEGGGQADGGVRRQLKRARDAIAVKERQAAAAKRQAAARFADLKAAQAERQAKLESLESREQALSDNLAAISSQIAGAGGPAPTAAAPAPLTPGQSADYISESQASVPSGAPPAVAAAIEAANSIATTPYVWGGGHGSFESSGYDCSGAVSFALHGGGLLDSPLDSTGLETWGEAGAGQWITVYANAGHAWVMIAGLAFDTSGGAGPRWHPSPVSSTAGFIARHPPGY